MFYFSAKQINAFRLVYSVTTLVRISRVPSSIQFAVVRGSRGWRYPLQGEINYHIAHSNGVINSNRRWKVTLQVKRIENVQTRFYRKLIFVTLFIPIWIQNIPTDKCFYRWVSSWVIPSKKIRYFKKRSGWVLLDKGWHLRDIIGKLD